MVLREVVGSSELRKLTDRTEGRLLVVKFTATWCGPCRQVAPQYEALAQRTPDVEFVKVMAWNRGLVSRTILLELQLLCLQAHSCQAHRVNTEDVVATSTEQSHESKVYAVDS